MNQTFILKSRAAELGAALDEIEDLLIRHTADRDLAGDMRLIAEEALSNVIRHAYGADRPEEKIEVQLGIGPRNTQLEIRDSGDPFNPLDLPAPDLSLSIDERRPGGLGVHLIRALTDRRTYRREGAENILLLEKDRKV